MIPYEEALEIVLRPVTPLAAEEVSLGCALGRALAEAVPARTDMPPFDNSSVDGYAVRLEDLRAAAPGAPVTLPVRGTLPAGRVWEGRLAPGTSLRVMTGAPVPEGTQACIKREEVGEEEGRAVFSRPAAPGENIRPRGGEYRAGAHLLGPGTRVTPPVLAVLASQGLERVVVHRRPKVFVLVTGSELAAPGEPLAPGQIYDSNAYGLEAACRALGLSEIATGRCGDDPAVIGKALRESSAHADVVLTSGGVSVGDFDFVPGAFEALGGERCFWKVAVKPGKPTYFGQLEMGGRRSFLFGLPGNPVGALLSFERLVRPALLAMAGFPPEGRGTVPARLAEPLVKGSARLEWVRGVLEAREGERWVTPIALRESHMLTSLARADALIVFPAGARSLEAGDRVEVHPLWWSP